MTIDLTFLCGVNQVDGFKTSYSGDRFSNKYHVTTDRDKIISLIRGHSNSLGSVEYNYLISKSSAVIYYKEKIERNYHKFVEEDMESRILDDLVMVQGLLERMWILKDHCVFQDRAWLIVENRGNVTTHSNNWSVRHSLSSGKTSLSKFSTEEMRVARRLVPIGGTHLQGSGAATSLVKSTLRFQRFMYFIQIARSTPDVAMKIAQYCSALEALVSSSSAELSHQVAERVACLLEPIGEARQARFKRVKTAYNYRSKAVHGASFEPSKFQEIIDSSVYIDQTCRDLAMMYIVNDNNFAECIEGKQEIFENYFNNLIFGVVSNSVN